MKYLGDYAEDYTTLNFKFSTHKADGTPITLAGTPAVSVYKGSSEDQSTAGITLSVGFDTTTGLHNVLIDLSANAFYAIGQDYSVVITTGTVDGVSVVGTVLASFSIENRFAEGTLTAAERTAVAEALLKLDWTDMTGEAARSVLNALRFLRNKWSVSAGTLTVTKENDTTSAWTSAITSNAAAEPIIGSDPA